MSDPCDRLAAVSPLYPTENLSEGAQATAAKAEDHGSVTSEEVQRQRVVASPTLPTLSELQKHRITHLPYRAWCPDCVEAFAREMAHHQSSLERREFPLISVDYFFLSSEGVITRDETDET